METDSIRRRIEKVALTGTTVVPGIIATHFVAKWHRVVSSSSPPLAPAVARTSAVGVCTASTPAHGRAVERVVTVALGMQ
jgi:hypothetical protein